MQLKEMLGAGLAIFMLLFLPVNPVCSETKKEEKISFSGVIEGISNDLNWIIVNEARIFLSPNTQIVDEGGKICKIGDLKPKRHVLIEALPSRGGLLAKKIFLKRQKKEQ